MKPAFALSFSTTGISLHHLSEGEWYSIGTVSLDADDLNAQIHALRDQAFALENDLSCNVVIPADQIRYLSVETGDLSPEDSAQKVRDELVAATPYEQLELSFATATQDGTTFGAAVSLQTLNEAQSFTAEHGFVPVAYTADPDEDTFPGKPVFDLEPAPVAPVAVPEIEHPAARVEPEVEEEPEPKVHVIAETAAPDAFRSPAPPDADVPSGGKGFDPKRLTVPAIAAAAVLAVAIGAWSLMGAQDEDVLAEGEPDFLTATPDEEAAQDLAETPPTETEVAGAPATDLAPDDDVVASVEPSATQPQAPDDQPALSPTDAAILEALKVQPTPVEEIERDTDTAQDVEPGVIVVDRAPDRPSEPTLIEPDDLYLASIDKSDFSNDAVALAPAESFETDLPFDAPALTRAAVAGFDLDERGLVVPSPDGTLNPDGIMVYLGRPSSVPPDVPTRFEEEPVVEETDTRLAGFRPKPRPDNLDERFERQQLGGRSLEELAVMRPKLRPESLQAAPEVDDTPTALAVVRVPRPKTRPAGLVRVAAATPAASNLGSTAAVDQNSDEAGSFQPKAVAPKIPSTASVARQATIDNAINLRRLNLIGVYGTPANRRALVRLPSGRYKKLKVGDRVDGGKVIAISDSELRYQKKGRNVTLSMPRG